MQTDWLISSWHHARKAIALCLQFKARFIKREVKKSGSLDVRIERPLAKIKVTLPELQEAEREIVRVVQHKHFSEELQVLTHLNIQGKEITRNIARQRNQTIKRYSSLYRLDPFLDDDGLIRVGGRIKRARLSFTTKHPIILPRESHVTNLLVQSCHTNVNHMGRGTTHNELRQRGYWLIGGTSVVSNYITRCVLCRRLRGFLQHQKMADLPKDRIEPSPPFILKKEGAK